MKILEALDTLSLKDISVDPYFITIPTQPIPKKYFEVELRNYFANLEAELSLDQLVIIYGGEKIELNFSSKKESDPIIEGYLNNSLESEETEKSEEQNFIVHIKEKIEIKYKNYKKYGFPLILAINLSCEFNIQHVVKALFGTDRSIFKRNIKGIWGKTNSNSANTNLIGLLVTSGFCLTTMLEEDKDALLYYPNPFVNNNCKSEFNQMTIGEYEDGIINYKEGKSIQEILNLV
jgi:hypothetical protein